MTSTQLSAPRFVFQERLGASLHRAYDRQRGATVAVKLLARLEAGARQRLESEFRALAGIAHPNLLQLYDLAPHDGAWLVTMERVEGVDFIRHVRPPRSTPPESLVSSGELALEPEQLGFDSWRAAANDNVARRGALDEGRLRNALRQLAEGLCALHASGHLHRDLKPANVLVSARDARLVIADYGLGHTPQAPGVVGTLAYMSPEQMTGHAASEASDWYAVGVMLYEALAGSVPFSARASVREQLAAKQRGLVVHPSTIAREAPEDLGDLALALIEPDPAKRPRYAELVARLDGPKKRPSLGPGAPSLVGREVPREQLASAFAEARVGRAAVALVSGRAGMGKSALVQSFLDTARAQGALVFAGRCHEREELPHKALEPLLDALGGHLLSAELVLPADIAALARLFPSLRRVPKIAAALGRGEPIDPLEQKARALVALRALCASLAQRQPLVWFIDDLQWGDAESAPLLAALLQVPGVLLVAAHRPEDGEGSLVKALRARLAELAIAPVEVAVDALASADVYALALALLRGVEDAEEAAHLVASEAGGSPFMARELALHVRARGTASERQPGALVAARLRDLPEDSRAMFALIAAAGRPEKRALLERASQLDGQAFSALRVLEARNLVHSTGPLPDDRIDAYHDQLREQAYAALDASTRQRLHRALAEALEQSAERDAEALCEHWRRSDQPMSSGRYALEAARKAESQLAFARAARLYSHVLERLALDDEQRGGTIERLGYCLALAGRSVDAADAFRLAAMGAAPLQAMQLRAFATTQLLRAGELASAERELASAAELTGLSLPPASWQLRWRRLRIRLQGLKRRPPDTRFLPRVDMLWGLASGMSVTDAVHGALYQAEHTWLALRSRDPYRMARALGAEAVRAASANRRPARTQFLLDRGLELGGLSGEPHALAVVKGSAGMARLLEGRFREAQRLTREAQRILRERLHTSLGFDLSALQSAELQATAYLGDVRELAERVPEALRDAEARGDLHAAVCCRSGRSVWAWLGPDQVVAAYRQVTVAEAQWSQQGYHLTHWRTTQALAEVDLYADQPGRSLARLRREWKQLRALRQVQHTRIESWDTRGRLALAQARKGDREPLLRAARADARAIQREGVPWAFALGRLLEACLASFGDVARALSLLRELDGQFEALDMRLHQEVVRCRHGQLLGGEEGRASLVRAESALRALGVVRPHQFVGMLAPGFPDFAGDARRG